MWVFGADLFRPFEHRLPIGHGRGPRRGEDTRIFDRDVELKVLAPEAEIDGQWLGAGIFFSIPLQSFFRAS